MFVGWSQPWARTVYASVAKLFFCHYCYGGKLNATKQQHYFTGKASNVLTAQLMGDYLVASILRECRKLYTHNLDPRSRAFATGAASRLWSRVLELVVAKQRELSEESESRALVLASLYDREDSANRAHLQELGINVTTEKSRASANLNSRAFAAGSEYANTVGLDLQLEKDADKPQLR